MLCVASLYSDLAAERHQLSTSLQESHKLASQVDRLGTQLDQVNEEKQKVRPHKHSLLKFFFSIQIIQKSVFISTIGKVTCDQT